MDRLTTNLVRATLIMVLFTMGYGWAERTVFAVLSLYQRAAVAERALQETQHGSPQR